MKASHASIVIVAAGIGLALGLGAYTLPIREAGPT